MPTKSLKKHLDELANSIGGPETPDFGVIKGKLLKLSNLAEALEGGQSLAEKDARIAELETELGRLQLEMQTAKAEIKKFREEEKKREEETEVPDVQFQILQRLPSKQGGIGWTLMEIAYIAGLSVEVAEIHVTRLRNERLIERDWGHNAEVWYRTVSGSEHVLARDLAREEEEPRPERRKHGDLRKDAQEILLLIARSAEGIKEFELLARSGADAYLYLEALRNERFINSDAGRGGLANRILTLAGKGEEYIRERHLL